MAEENVRKELQLPWMSFGSDAEAPAPEGQFLESGMHPRAYGNFARLLGKYVREEKLLTLQEAVRRLTGFPASVLSLSDRGLLRRGYFADIVLFDPARIKDHSTFQNVHQLSTGVENVWVNGMLALDRGKPTKIRSGRVVRGRAWSGAGGGGCRDSSDAWTWSK
jgi:N-acyl-D-amino-acid deacylase